jgi:hypothetical protein
MDNKESGTGIVTMATEGGGTHARDGTISRGVLTIRTIRWETITPGGGCDITLRSRMTLLSHRVECAAFSRARTDPFVPVVVW